MAWCMLASGSFSNAGFPIKFLTASPLNPSRAWHLTSITSQILSHVILVPMTHGDSFNQSVQGRLRIGTPSARPCYSKYSGMAASPDPTACAVIQQNHTSSVFQAEYYGGFQEIQDDIYASVPGDQCLLDNTNPQNPPCVH
jgi:hypothetical protein